jgi:hypothetical protein
MTKAKTYRIVFINHFNTLQGTTIEAKTKDEALYIASNNLKLNIVGSIVEENI